MTPEEYEKEGRNKVVKALLNINELLHIHNAPIKNNYDLWFESATTNNKITIIVECKDRTNTSTKYDTYMLSKLKYDTLREQYSAKTQEIWYVNTFTDGVAMVWNIYDCPVEIGRITHKKYTCWENGGKVAEDMVYFRKEHAKYIVKYE